MNIKFTFLNWYSLILSTSANYNKDENKITGGKNGFGAKLTNIYSTKFIIETVDSKK